MNIKLLSARIGSTAYLAWSGLHTFAAFDVYGLSRQMPDGILRGRLMQESFYLVAFATGAATIALALNWRNDRQGYWINGLIVGVADVPFVLFLIAPGYMPLWPYLAGPLLWLLAFALTSFARVGGNAA